MPQIDILYMNHRPIIFLCTSTIRKYESHQVCQHHHVCDDVIQIDSLPNQGNAPQL